MWVPFWQSEALCPCRRLREVLPAPTPHQTPPLLMDTRRPQGAAHPFSLGTDQLLVIPSWRAGYHFSFTDPLGVSYRRSLPPQTRKVYRTPARREGRRIFSLCIAHSAWGTARHDPTNRLGVGRARQWWR